MKHTKGISLGKTEFYKKQNIKLALLKNLQLQTKKNRKRIEVTQFSC